MKKSRIQKQLIRLSMTVILLMNFISGSFAQVTITGAVPAGINTSYTSLTNTGGAFQALNTATAGNIVVTITADLLSETGVTALNDRPLTSVKIIPSGVRLISGTVDGGNGLIPLNGADSVTIDGLNSGGNSLTIQNLSIASSGGTSTLKIYNTTQYLLITNCTILGSSTSSNVTSSGTILFGTNGTVGGNSNNTISGSKIGDASAGLPSKGIYSYGSGSGNENKNNTVINCEIYNYSASTAIQSNGILIYSGSSYWTISNNKFYQTAARSLSAKHCAIQFYSNTSSGNLVSDNFIGGNNAAGTGTYTITAGSANNQFSAILMAQSGIIRNNTITNISQTTGSTLILSQAFCGIEVSGSALVEVTYNTIGSQTTNGVISFTGISTGRCEVYGIYNGNTAQGGTISNNKIGGITLANSSTGGINFDGIGTNFNSTHSLLCKDNVVGGTIANSINNTSAPAGASARLYGIGFIQTKVGACSGNIIRNLTAVGGPGAGSEICGIFAGSDKSKQIRNNVICNLSHTGTAKKEVWGIYFLGSSTETSVIEKNFINSISNNTTNGGEMGGIKIYTSTAGSTNTIINNIINISSNTTNSMVYGINDASTHSNKIYHNTISITGSTTSGSSSSLISGGTNTRDVRDNIFYNTRTGGTENLSMKVTSTTNLLEDYNNLKGTVSGLTLGSHSVTIDPSFVNPSSAVASDFTPSAPLNALSSPINATVPDDYFGNIRSGNPKMGAIDKSSTLPVTLLSFTATCNSSTVDLKWITASEINNHYFEIEKSNDGVLWKTIAHTNGNGNSNIPIEYQASDLYDNAAISYYRLIQVDYDGKTTFFDPISAVCSTDELTAKMRTYPNPVINQLFVEIEVPLQAEAVLNISNTSGQLVEKQDIHLSQGANKIEINTDKYPQNMYVITLISNQFIVPSTRFVLMK
jgi:trimeric autotransporter adhesin